MERSAQLHLHRLYYCIYAGAAPGEPVATASVSIRAVQNVRSRARRVGHSGTSCALFHLEMHAVRLDLESLPPAAWASKAFTVTGPIVLIARCTQRQTFIADRSRVGVRSDGSGRTSLLLSVSKPPSQLASHPQPIRNAPIAAVLSRTATTYGTGLMRIIPWSFSVASPSRPRGESLPLRQPPADATTRSRVGAGQRLT